MNQSNRCPRCGGSLAPGTAPEACPKCLMGIGLEKTEPGGETRTSHGVPRWNAPAPEEIAADFPQLEILEVLGQGGMGVVYKARQKSLDRMVALKILAVRSDAGPAFAERFAREARALASLSHPSIVTVYDFGEAGGRYFLSMEYVDGANLHELIHDGEITPGQALQLVTQICDALQFAHDSGVVHRDIKPENILVDQQGRVKIADFGLARIMGKSTDELRLTGAGQVMGTAHYMAPEQIERPLEVDHRADIYSLGVVFYELLTGELPLGRFQPPSKKVQVDVRIDEVVLKTLEKEPQLRYQTASEIKTDVEGISSSPRPSNRDDDTKIYAAAFNIGWPAVAIIVALVLAALAVPVALITLRDSGRDASVPSTESTAISESAATGVSSSRAHDAPLIQAAARGDVEGVEILLDNGIGINSQGPGGTTALIEAVDAARSEVIQLLLDRGANVNAANSRGVTPILIAASQGNFEIAGALLDRGANPNVTGPDGTTALIQAIDGGHNDIVELLISRGANVNHADERGAAPLHLAASAGRTWIAELLVATGASLNAQGPGGDTPLILAVQENHGEVVRILLEAGANPNVRGRQGRTALQLAAAEGREQMLHLFRKNEAR
jgi:serine/threonine protein kinase/ankyrin repeat protein